jgi:excisionase family DNA binding protein
MLPGMKAEDDLLSTAEVAEQLGVTRQRVLELITESRLPARKVGRSYIVRAADVAALEIGAPGRPPNAAKAPAKKAAKKGTKR